MIIVPIKNICFNMDSLDCLKKGNNLDKYFLTLTVFVIIIYLNLLIFALTSNQVFNTMEKRRNLI